MTIDPALQPLVDALTAYQEDQATLTPVVEKAQEVLGSDWISFLQTTIDNLEGVEDAQKEVLKEKANHAVHYYGALAAWEESFQYLNGTTPINNMQLIERIPTLEYWLSLFGEEGTKVINRLKGLLNDAPQNEVLEPVVATAEVITEETTDKTAFVAQEESVTTEAPANAPSDVSGATEDILQTTTLNDLPQVDVITAPQIEEAVNEQELDTANPLTDVQTAEEAVLLPEPQSLIDDTPHKPEPIDIPTSGVVDEAQLAQEVPVPLPQQEEVSQKEELEKREEAAMHPKEDFSAAPSMEIQEAQITQETLSSVPQESEIPEQPGVVTNPEAPLTSQEVPTREDVSMKELHEVTPQGLQTIPMTETVETVDILQTTAVAPEQEETLDEVIGYEENSDAGPSREEAFETERTQNINIPKTKNWEIANFLHEKELYENATNWISARCVRLDNIDKQDYPYYGFVVDLMRVLKEDIQNLLDNQLLEEVIDQEVEGGREGMERLKKSIEEELENLTEDLKIIDLDKKEEEIDPHAILGEMDTSTEKEYIGPAPDGFELIEDPYAASPDKIIEDYEKTEEEVEDKIETLNVIDTDAQKSDNSSQRKPNEE